MIFWVLACTGVEKEVAEGSEKRETGTLRFVALGDAGEGNEAQYAVADTIQSVCEQKGCDFALYLGDNFYDVGTESIEDSQFVDKFELPYANLDFPFYVTLGNHDYGGGHLIDRPESQVEYSDHSEKWNLPDRYYDFTFEHVQFLSLDTNALMWSSQWGGYEEQAAWASTVLSESQAGWNIVFGHHPYISNGGHGVAGQYDGLIDIPIGSGEDIKTFVEDEVCGKADVYFCGHDHDLQWLEATCGTEFIVSGAGAKNRDLAGWDVPTHFETDATPGFVWVEIVDLAMRVQFYAMNGTILYESMLVKE